jgi:hypothetical protein
MGYYVDLSQISLDQYRHKLEVTYLVPSRIILKERLEERFGYFKNLGIKNLNELIQTLRNKKRFIELSKVGIFSGDYLVILLRELNSIHPKPNKISDFKGISPETILKLEKSG